MTREREREIERICQEALERPREARDSFLKEACGSDAALRREIDQLLAHERQAAGFLSVPAVTFEVDLGHAAGPALRPGQQLGNYLIQSSLGSGGMGEVYRARDATLAREVAIKVLPPAFTGDRERLARFEREARVLASLNHPNIATIHGIERVDGLHALVLELVEGDTLEQSGPLAIDRALTIARQIVDALDAAHTKGIVHRDLKPANIKVRPDGVVKVLDFGLAKAIGSKEGGRSDTLTGDHALLGTAAYMSPEQARGRAVDRRTDIWAFGCVLYEMLTGRIAFTAQTTSDTISAILAHEIDFSVLPRDTPASVRRVLQRCLVKDPAHRLRDIADARVDLDDVKELAARDAPPPGRHRVRALAATAAVIAAAVGFSLWRTARQSPPAPGVVRFSLDAHPSLAFPTLSPDGQHLVYGTDEGLYRRSMSDPVSRLIAGTEGDVASYPTFSPDGRLIAFYSGRGAYGGTIKTVPLTGGAAVSLLAQDFPPYGMSWDAEGIVFARSFGKDEKGIVRVVPGVAREELLIQSSGEFIHGPQLLPDGETMLFSIAAGADADRWDKGRIVAQSLTSGQRQTLIDGGADARYVASGHIVYANGNALFAVPFDARRLQLLGEPVRVVDGVKRSPAPLSGSAHFAVSPIGTLVYVSDPPVEYELALIDRAGSVRPLQFPSALYRHPRISPDGKQFVVETRRDDESIIWVADIAGAALRRLTFEGRSRFPVWTTDGQRITFQSDRQGDAGIFWQAKDGGQPAERLTTPQPGTSHIPEAWSPSGEYLLFRVAAGSRYSLWTYSRGDGTVQPFGAVESAIPPAADFSPDGRWVAYTAREADKFVISVQPFPSSGARYQAVEGGIFPAWSQDGRELFYFYGANQFAFVKITQRPVFSAGPATNVWSQPPEHAMLVGEDSYRGFDPTRDGKFLTIVPARQSTNDLTQVHVVLNWPVELAARQLNP